MRERLGLDPDAVEPALARIARCLGRADALTRGVEAMLAEVPHPFGPPQPDPALALWIAPLVDEARRRLRRAAEDGWWLIEQVRAHVEEQRMTSSAEGPRPGTLPGGRPTTREAAARAMAVGDPSLVAALTPAGRAAAFALLDDAPVRRLALGRADVVGGLDGAPAWARDLANRQRLARIGEDPGSGDEQRRAAASIAGAIEDLERRRDGPVTLLTLELPPAGDAHDMRVAVAYGDLDRASNLAILVPGMHTTIASLDTMAAGAANLRASMDGYDPRGRSAVVAWIGYETPGLGSVVSDDLARSGGRSLASLLAGLNAASPDARLTVFAHSYGTRVATYALSSHAEGARADGLFLFGSPGIAEGIASADQLDVPPGELFATRAEADRVAPFGLALSQPGSDRFAADIAGTVGVGLLGTLGGLVAAAGVAGVLEDPGTRNRDPANDVPGVRLLGADGGADGRAVGGHGQLASDGRGYLDLGSDSLHDMALVGVGRGREAH